MAFLFKSKKNQDRALSSRDGPPSSQSSLQGAPARVARDEKSSHQRSTPTGSVNSIDEGSLGSPDQGPGYGRPRGQSTDQMSEKAAMQQQTSDLPVSLLFSNLLDLRPPSAHVMAGYHKFD